MFKSHPRSRPFRKLGPPDTWVTPTAGDVRRLAAQEADEFCSILARGAAVRGAGSDSSRALRTADGAEMELRAVHSGMLRAPVSEP